MSTEKQGMLLLTSGPHVALTVRGQDILFDDDRMVCLTDIWRSAGSPAEKKPNDWSANPQAAAFIANAARNLNTGKSGIWKTRRGKHLGGTWAHWQVALAYAEYLDPEIHFLVHQAFRDWAMEQVDPDLKASRTIDLYRRQGHSDEEIAVRFEGILARHTFTDELKELGVKGAGYSEITDDNNVIVIGATAKEIKIARGAPPCAPTRNYLEPYELAALRLTELMAVKKLRAAGARGNTACRAVCRTVATAVRGAVDTLDA